MLQIDYQQIQKAVAHLKNGEIIAYPTEGVYGFGCDPFNPDAIGQLLQIKHRSIDKGFILVASTWEQIEPYIMPIAPHLLTKVRQTWPGPVTWIFPAQPNVPSWITGKHTGIAVRVSDHPIVRALCDEFGEPIASTSANIEGSPPAREYRTIELSFGDQLAFIVKGQVGGRQGPTEIRDAITGEVIRGC